MSEELKYRVRALISMDDDHQIRSDQIRSPRVIWWIVDIVRFIRSLAGFSKKMDSVVGGLKWAPPGVKRLQLH